MNNKNQKIINIAKNVTETLGALLPDLMMLCLFFAFEFTLLKMVDVLPWSWIWVLSPAWGFVAFAILLLIPTHILKNKKRV